ncbi:MAG: hypothetical protein IBX40_05320 [Methanosarcinales archaeon]|nr:hypothetical protein [Methanosarcinales archaeon]
MSKQTVLHILKDIFQAYGYDLESSYLSDILASKGISDRIYIKLDESGDYSSLRSFADSMKQTEGTGLYILNNNVSREAADFAAQQNLILWDKPELEKQIGKAILAHAQGIQMELDLGKVNDLPLNIFNSPKPEPKESIFGLFNESSQSEPEQPKSSLPGSSSSPMTNTFSQSPITIKEQDIKIQLPSLPINMAKTSAIKIGQAKLGEVQDFIMKFIPHYSYNYNFEIKRKFRSGIMDLNGQGEGVVNGITGEHKFASLPEPLETIELPTENYQIKEPQVTDKEAKGKAIGLIIDKHTEKKKSDLVKDDAIIVESKTISPSESEINISMHLVYIPIWEIRGKRNSIEINAYDGHVLEEPSDDDTEFVI